MVSPTKGGPSRSGGVNVVSIAGRMARERERLIGMSDEERAWRAKFVKSQNLAKEEPIMPEGYTKAYYNPLRRFYQAPLNKVEAVLLPKLGAQGAYLVRHVTAKFIMGGIAVYGGWYYMKYNKATWMRKSGWAVTTSRNPVLPGDKGYPNYEVKKPNQYATYGFEKSPI